MHSDDVPIVERANINMPLFQQLTEFVAIYFLLQSSMKYIANATLNENKNFLWKNGYFRIISTNKFDMYILKTLTILFTALLAIGCRPAIKETNVSTSDHLNGKWELRSVSMDTSVLNDEFEGTRPYLSINYAKLEAGGYSGCNSFSGKFEHSGNAIRFLPLTATQRGCAKKGEHIYFRQLERTRRFVMTGDSLIFLAKDTVLLSFVRIKDKG